MEFSRFLLALGLRARPLYLIAMEFSRQYRMNVEFFRRGIASSTEKGSLMRHKSLALASAALNAKRLPKQQESPEASVLAIPVF